MPKIFTPTKLASKAEWAQNRIRLNASGFMYDYSDLQIRLPVPTGGVDIQNVAEANIKGFEIEGAAVFIGRVYCGDKYRRTRYENHRRPNPGDLVCNAALLRSARHLPLALEDVSGNQLTRAPAFQSFCIRSIPKTPGPAF